MKTVNDIRSEFLGFFKNKGHEIVDSSSLVPQNDPTLMFTNAGMVQFKDVFTGKETRPYTRATTSQKCVRAGGKHNDLENVGYTARHHTFFEMLGNFSFGDYFKEDAIAFAWELVTKNFALPADKLCVTVHSSDEEAAAIWKKVSGLSDNKIIRIPTDDNFWRMGDTGPCGPCTEIFYDHGEHIWGGPPGSPQEDGDRFIEIWNNVFMQYEQIDVNTRIDLPAQSVDTGMGLERIAATLMGSNSNYDIDILRSIIEHSAELTGIAPDGDMAASHKVIADHLRASGFLMADGVMPGNEGRGYVLRRIMRRAMRHAHLLGAKDPLMHKLFPTLLGKMGQAYPELERAKALITQTLETEEKRFKATLDRGLKMLDEETKQLSSDAKFPGDVAFKLYDTYGFPLDLTQDALRAQNIEVDTDGFNTCMEEQKAKARAAWSGTGEVENEKLWFDIMDELGPTEFLGYDKTQAEAKVLAIVKNGKRADSLDKGEEGIIITNQTPFYAESGGQVGDKGYIIPVSSLQSTEKEITKNEIIKTKRLTLKIITKDCVNDVFETINYQSTAQAVPFLSWPVTIDHANKWAQDSEAGIETGDDYRFIAFKEDGKPVGCIAVHFDDDAKETNRAEIGYWVSQPYQQQGYAQEMLREIIDFAFHKLALLELWATTRTDNDISAHILEKQEFILDTRRDVFMDSAGIYRPSKLFILPKSISVSDVKKYVGALSAHHVKCIGDAIKTGDNVQMKVDEKRRDAIKRNHSATHLMHEALRRVLGEHVVQKGSLQDDLRTRFDISQPVAMTLEQIAKVEHIVNKEILANTSVNTGIMELEEARKAGAMALFGEKYDDEVRVLTMGRYDGEEKKPYSIELCGGTHVERTGDIGAFKIISESALSAGIRRIEAISGENAIAYLTRQNQLLQDIAAIMKTSSDDAFERVQSLLMEKKHLEKEAADLRKKIALCGGGADKGSGSADNNVKEIGGVKFTGRILEDFPPKDLKSMADELKKQIGSGVVALISTAQGKASIVVGVTDDLTEKLSAVDLVRTGSQALGGKGGGGRPDMAQAGGPDCKSSSAALAAIEGKLAG